MVFAEEQVHILYALWMFELRKAKDPDLEKKYELVKVILGRLGYENGEKFDAAYEKICRREDERDAKGNYFEPCYD